MDRQKIERSIKGLSEWQMHVQAESDIDTNISTAIEALKAQLSKEGATSDLISRTETVEHLRRVLDATVPITDYDEGYVDGVQFAISTVSTMPTIQPEPQEGHWIWVAGELMCSECRTIYSDLYPDYDNAVACPHCGARMTTSK